MKNSTFSETQIVSILKELIEKSFRAAGEACGH